MKGRARNMMLVFMIGVVVAGALAVASAMAEPAAEVDRPASGFTLSPTMALTADDATYDQVADGMDHAPMLRLAFVNTGAADTLTDVAFTGANTDDANVESVSLWLDDGDGAFEPYGDDAPALAANAGMDGVFSGLTVAVPSGTTYLFASYGVVDGAADGNLLDMFIGVGDVVLASAGTNDATEDPAGSSAIRDVTGGGLYTPYTVYGFLRNEDGSNAGAGIVVNVDDTTTGMGMTATSDALGRYEADLSLLVGGYADGDAISVDATSGGLTAGNSGTVDVLGAPSLQLDITFHDAPSSNVVAAWPYNNTGSATIPYAAADPAPSSGLAYVELWFNYNGGAYALFATDALITNEFTFNDFSNGEGTYGFYTIAADNFGDVEAAPAVADATVVYDITLPTVAPAVADKAYVNNAGTGGDAPPITVTASISDANLLAGSFGVRPYMETPNDVYFITFNASADPTVVAYDANCYLLDGTLVTVNVNDPVYGSDLVVFGDLNTAHAVGEVIGKTVPAYYALFDEFGVIQAVYDTQGTLWHTDDTPVLPSPADTFYAYHYDGGHGFVVAAIHAGTDTLAIVDTPLPEGRYTFVSTGIDKAQNYNWVGEAGGAADFIVDNTMPTSSCTIVPETNTNGSWVISYAADDPSAATPSGLAYVELYLSFDGGAYALVATDNLLVGYFLWTDVSYGEELYAFYTVAADNTGNAEAAPAAADDAVFYDGTLPAVAPVVIDKPFINNAGTGGVAPPMEMTASISDDNLLSGAFGVRKYNAYPDDVYYLTWNASVDPTVWTWDVTYYTLDGTLVTVTVDAYYLGELVVFGDLNSGAALGAVYGKTLPHYYALFDEFGIMQTVYDTLDTPGAKDDVIVATGPADTFYAYHYDGGHGFVVAAIHADPTTMALVNVPMPEGRYTLVPSAMDLAGNTNWVGEAGGTASFIVDNTAPTSSCSIAPTYNNNGTWYVSYAYSDAYSDNYSGVVSVQLWFNVNGGGYTLFGTDALLTGKFAFNDVSAGSGTYGFYTIAVDATGNAEAAPGAPDDGIDYEIAFTLNFVQGWNLVSIPVINAEYDLGAGAQPLDRAIDFASMNGAKMVSRWNPATQRYVSFIVGFHNAGDSQNFILTVDDGYFVWFADSYSLDIVGSSAGARNVAVSPGWNVLGWASTAPGDAGTDWAGQVQAGALDHIAGYNTATDDFATDVYMFPADVLALTPGRGYFVWSDFSTTVSY